ncbi:hypothetical protein D1872_276660 [compost metagenome]
MRNACNHLHLGGLHFTFLNDLLLQSFGHHIDIPRDTPQLILTVHRYPIMQVALGDDVKAML